MFIEKNEKLYTVTESSSKWRVRAENGKLEVSVDVPKDICATEEDLRAYVLSHDELF